MSTTASIYRATRNYENLQRRAYAGVRSYDIPPLAPAQIRQTDVTSLSWISFNYAQGCKAPELHGMHFFVDDYQFTRLWNRPDAYLDMLARFACVCTPDFSTYADFPRAMQIYNHYRKHWLGAYWQDQGMTVIPTISWSDEDSFDWCFDGEPEGGAVAISSVGTQRNSESKELFRLGYNEMLARLEPSLILFFGSVPSGLNNGPEIVRINTFQDRLRNYNKRIHSRKEG